MKKVTDCQPGSLGSTLTVTLPHFKDMKKPTMGETYQYLNKLITSKTSQEFENLSELISSNTRLALFETSLQLILIDSLHLKNEVSRILLSQNDYQIKRILSCNWFFQNLSFEYCANYLLPYISVSLRCKIINRLSKHLRNAEEAEKYFAFIKNNYSVERAEYLLPRCSPEFILNYVKNVNPTFEHNTGLRVLLNICKRHVEVGIYILSSIFDMKKENSFGLHKYRKILLYFAGYHSDSVVPFLKKYRSYMPSNIFGKKLTKKLQSRVKEYLFMDFMKNSVFSEKHLFSVLTFEEKVKMIAKIVIYKFEELTFNSWKESSTRVASLMKMVPAKDRLRMIEAAFKEVYNLNYNAHANCWSSEILELIPTKSRQPYVIKLEAILNTEVLDRDENERDISFDAECFENLIYLYDSSTAFEKFNKIIHKTPFVERRESILCCMVKNCKINNDPKMLEEMIEFIVVYHRDDNPFMLYRFINFICENFPAGNLTLSIFKNLENLLYYLVLKGFRNPDVYKWLMEKHVHYLFENNMNVDSFVEYFFKSVILGRQFVGELVRDFKSKHSKTLILIYFEKAVPLIPVKSSKDDVLLGSLLFTCWKYNKLNKRNRIFLKDIPGLEEILKARLKEKYNDAGAEEWPLDVWEKYHINVLEADYKQKCLFYISGRNPIIINRHLKGFLTLFFSGYFIKGNLFRRNIEQFMMTASFFEKTEAVKEITLNEFNNVNSERENRKNVLTFYSYICSIEEFNEIIEKYLPSEEKVHQQSEDDFDAIQILIPSLIKNVRPRWKNLQLSWKFFFGDFLKIVLPSFSSCCYHTRYDYVIPFLKERLDAVPQKISYRKPIIRLIVELSDREEKFSFLLKCWEEYKHYSVRSSLLLHISKTFLEVPSKKSFQVLERCILDCGTAVIEYRPNLWKVPKVFWNDYVSALWHFSQKLENPLRNKFRELVFSCFNRDNIGFLSPEFCESIIKDNLFNPSCEFRIYDFTVLYLIVNSEAVECRLRIVLDLIKNRKPNARSIYDFINVLIVHSLENPVNSAQLFKVLLENWPEYPNGVLFEERTLLTYYFLYYKTLKKCPDSNIVPLEFGKELKKFYSNVENLNDLFVIYAKVLNNFFNHFKTFEAVFAVRELIKDSQDRTLAVLAILSTPMEAVVLHKMEDKIFDKIHIERKKVLSDIVKTLESYKDNIVEIYLRSKFDFVK